MTTKTECLKIWSRLSDTTLTVKNRRDQIQSVILSLDDNVALDIF